MRRGIQPLGDRKCFGGPESLSECNLVISHVEIKHKREFLLLGRMRRGGK